MNLSRKNVALSVGGGALALILAAAAVLLYRGIRQFGAAERKLKQAEVALQKLYAKDPFPSPENIQREKENVTVLKQWYASLTEELSKGQVSEVQKSPSAFMNMLSEKNNRLLGLAKKGRVALPENFAFGFDRYAAAGNLPAPDEVPRLTQQLTMSENIGAILIESGVKRIERVQRDEFEARGAVVPMGPATPGPMGRFGSGRPGQGGPSGAGEAGRDAGVGGMAREASDLYTRQHFVWEFVAGEEAIQVLLNRLASHPMFIVVTKIDISKTHVDVREAAAVRVGEKVGRIDPEGDEAAGGSGEFTSRHQRMVSGPGLEAPMLVRLEMDVYRFRGE